MTLAAAIGAAISDATGVPFAAPTLNPIGGGDINEAFGVSDGTRRYFVKANRAMSKIDALEKKVEELAAKK
mgnify:CR=1 FL=1